MKQFFYILALLFVMTGCSDSDHMITVSTKPQSEITMSGDGVKVQLNNPKDLTPEQLAVMVGIHTQQVIMEINKDTMAYESRQSANRTVLWLVLGTVALIGVTILLLFWIFLKHQK